MSSPVGSKRTASNSSDIASRTAYRVALLFALSGLMFNPWVGRLWRGKGVLDYRDVMTSYLFWSFGLATVVAAVAWVAGRARSQSARGVTLLVITVSSLLLLDRLLLVVFGLPLWVPDPILTYRHRPNAVRSWRHSGDPDEIIRINSYGHHDDPFPEAKPEGEVRLLVVGDSVAMGHHVTSAQTFSNQLEDLLRERLGGDYQVINTGVQGYGLRQESVVVKRSMRFSPDHVVVAFCMNDLEPVPGPDADGDRNKIDYHRVAPMPSRLLTYLLNETGFGRTALEMRLWQSTPEEERQRETERLRRIMSRPRSDPLYRAGWEQVLSQVDAMAAMSRGRNIGFTLILFPYEFQLWAPGLQHPQRIFAEYAAGNGIDLVDFTPVFESLLTREAASQPAERGKDLTELRRHRIWTYYLDEDHFTPAGHRVIASVLFKHLQGMPRATAGER